MKPCKQGRRKWAVYVALAVTLVGALSGCKSSESASEVADKAHQGLSANEIEKRQDAQQPNEGNASASSDSDKNTASGASSQ